MSARRVVVFGGSGFLGTSLVTALSNLGYTVLVPTRHRDRARHLLVLPNVQVLELGSTREDAITALVEGAEAVCFLVGILHERRPGDFFRVHVELLQRVVAAASSAGVTRLLHVSALGASAEGPSEYLRSKAAGEAEVRQSGMDWTIIQPSVIFGPGDSFLTLFHALMRWTLVVPLPAPNARFQPVYVGDVAQCLVRALGDRRAYRRTFPLCGPKVYTLREILAYIAELGGMRRMILGLGPSLSAIQAAVLELMPGKLLTRDNLRSMQKDSVCACPFPEIFALTPRSLESVAPDYLGPAAFVDRYLATREKRVG